MEYLEYFQLTSEPFSNAPLSRFYFASRQHTEALNRLMYAASSMKGLAILIGDIGHGKTTLARRMLDALPESEYEAAMLVIVHAGITPNWLLKRIASQLGVPDPAEDKLTILSQLYQRLLQIYQAGKRAVVIIDEAQMLASRELMEEFRGLLNLEVPDRKLITFVFFGLPEIVRNLQLDPPLAQRIALRYQLKALTADDTAAYIDHRLRIAGAKRQFFPQPVVQEVHRVTGGVPRLINTVCDNVLLEMFFAKRRLADLELVQQVAANFGLPQDQGVNTAMPPPMPIEEELALDGTPGHDAIVAVARHVDDQAMSAEPPPPPKEPSPFDDADEDDMPSAVSVIEAAGIAARVAREATPVPPEVDDAPPPPPAPTPTSVMTAKRPADIADPLAFLHQPNGAAEDDDDGWTDNTGDADHVDHEDRPILLDNVIEPGPKFRPGTNGAHETQVLTGDLANLDIEVVEEGAALGFGDDDTPELEKMTPAAEPLPQARAAVPLARITPVSRPAAQLAVTEKPQRPTVSPVALSSAPVVPASTPIVPTPKPPAPPVEAPKAPSTKPLQTSTGRTINLAEIDDLLNDLGTLTKKS